MSFPTTLSAPATFLFLLLLKHIMRVLLLSPRLWVFAFTQNAPHPDTSLA